MASLIDRKVNTVLPCRSVVSMTTGQGVQGALSPQPKARQSPSKQHHAQAAQQSGAAECVKQPHGAWRGIVPYMDMACAPSHLDGRAACSAMHRPGARTLFITAVSEGMHVADQKH